MPCRIRLQVQIVCCTSNSELDRSHVGWTARRHKVSAFHALVCNSISFDHFRPVLAGVHAFVLFLVLQFWASWCSATRMLAACGSTAS